MPRFWAQGTKLYQKNVLCVVKLILTKTVLTRKKGNQSVLIVGDLMSPTTKAVLLIRIKPSGNM